MNITKCFPGDIVFMQIIQNDLYGNSVLTMFEYARKKYQHALRVLNTSTQLGLDIKEKSGFDHRTIQLLHDRIAARFRRLNKTRLKQYSMTGVLHPHTDEQYYASLWVEYYDNMLDFFYQQYPEIICLILIACTYPNPDRRGIDAEDEIEIKTWWLTQLDNPILHEWEYAYSEIPAED